MQSILLIVFAAVVVVLASFVLRLSRRNSPLDGDVPELKRSLAEKDGEIFALKALMADLKQQMQSVASERNQLQAELGTARQELAVLSAKAADGETARQLMESQFAALAKAALESSGRTFLTLAEGRLNSIEAKSTGELNTKKAEIDGLVKPMADTLKNLDESVRSLRQSEANLLNETRQLASALKETKKRGNWGELQLKRIAELSGMEERCDFNLQPSILTDESRQLYPDMTVNLPNHRVIVVDSKASMESYKESASATDPIVQQQKLVEHGRAVRHRVDELAGKDYQRHVAGAADFVVCFIPSEAWFSAAVAVDPELLEYAGKKSVILASPTTLLTILRAVALGWKEAKIAAEAKQIFSLASDLYERFRKSTEYVEGVGSGLNSAIKQYNAFIGSVETRVFPQARKLQRLSGFVHELEEFEPIELVPRALVANDWGHTAEVLPRLLAEQETPEA